ncbi:MAG: hypothetical protein OEY10_00350 [Nitrosopumilus sp.]|nr:hypothetical protein [Nitrosopumilus sp.]
MKVRVDTITGKVLSAGEDKYPSDDITIIAVDVSEMPHSDLEFLEYDGNTVVLKQQADIDAIVSLRQEVINRPNVALAAIKNQVLNLLNETDQATQARVDAMTAAQVKTELGRIEILLKRIIEIIRPNLKEEASKT